MGHTLPDYTSKYKIEKVFSNVDNAELATRISKYTSVDRRGNCVWWDDFESAAALHWKSIASTTGTAVLSSDRAWMGDCSMKVATAAAINDYLTLVKVFSAPFSHTNGIEICFNIGTGKPSFELYLDGYSGSYYYEAGFRYDYNLGKIYYQDDTANWVELTKYDPVEDAREHWVPVKLVANWDTQEYIRCIFGGTQYDLSGIGLYKVISVTKQNVRPQIKTIAETAAAATVYYDNIIFTQNE